MNPVWRALVCALCVLWPSAGLAAGAGDGSAAATAAVNAAAPATTVNQNVAQGGSANASSAQSAASSDGVAGAHATIPPGTKITMSNWQQYKQFMPVGMIALFEGKYYWKMPADVEMDVVPTVNHPLPKAFVEASEKYGSQTKVVRLPDGRMNIENFITGWPFPHPSEPDMGYKILMDIWFYPGPYVAVVSPDGGDASFCTIDRFNNQACSKSSAVYRQLAFNWTPGIPRVDPRSSGAWFTQFLMLDKPEQSKYTASLTIFWQDLPKDEDDYVFVPRCGARCGCR